MTKLKIVVPTYNTQEWIANCLYSIASQTFKDWECLVINDASTDNTGAIIDSLDFVKNDSRFKVQHNKENLKALQNIVEGFNTLGCQEDPDCIMMAVDGDDHLFAPFSLQTIASVYEQNPWLLLTYGNWVGWPDGTRSNCFPYSEQTIRARTFRSEPFVASHLRTFRSKLWYNIDDADLRDDNGKYFDTSWDVAFMMPMLEMAAERHAFIDRILYCYNRYNPISDFRIYEDDQLATVDIIKNRRVYDRLEDG